MGNERLLTVRDVAKQLDVGYETVRRWLESGELKGFKMGRKLWRVRESDLAIFLKPANK